MHLVSALQYVSFIIWAYPALFSSIFHTEFFLFPIFAFFLPIDDTLNVEVPVVGGKIPLYVQTSCKVYHTVPSTLDFVRFYEDNALKFNGPKITVPSSDNWALLPHWIFGVIYGWNRIQLPKIISLLLVSLEYLYQSGHHQQNSSLLFLSLWCLVRKF